MADTEYATIDSIIPESSLHVRGTIPRPNGTEFWLSQPRPKGVSVDDWEKIQQEKWDRIFKKEVL